MKKVRMIKKKTKEAKEDDEGADTCRRGNSWRDTKIPTETRTQQK